MESHGRNDNLFMRSINRSESSMRFLLIRRVAVIDPASQRPGIAGRAVPARILPRTGRASSPAAAPALAAEPTR